MTMHKALHPRDDIDRLYVSIRDCVDAYRYNDSKTTEKSAEKD